MAWYRTGTISVTNASANVTGSGTAFIANVGIGEALLGPDGKLYEVESVSSDIALVLKTAYAGATAAGQAYAMHPSQSYIRDLAAQAATVINNNSEHIADPTAAHAASAIANTPAGGIAATTVQAAIDELASEKADLASPALTGAPTAPTAAAGTNTTQLATTAFVAGHITLASAAHAATAIANIPAGNIAATTVQAAINELDSEKQPLDAQLTTLAGITAAQATDLAAVSTFMGTVLNDADAATARVTLGCESTLLAEVTVGAATTSVSFTGLDIPTHRSYRIEVDYVDGAALTHSLLLYINNLTTPTDHYNQYLDASGASSGSAQANTAAISSCAANTRARHTIDLSLAPGGYAYATAQSVRASGAALRLTNWVWSRSVAVTNITDILLTASVANGIGIGSKFRLYRGDK